MTAPGPEGTPHIAEGPIFIPPDQHSTWGWTHAHRLPGTPFWLDMHKSASIAGGLLATAAATLISSANGSRSFEEITNIDWTTTSTAHHTETTTTDGSPQTEVSHKTATQRVPARPQTLHFDVSAANMPDVTSFNLATTPEAQVIIDQSDFSSFIDKLVGDIKDGYSIDNLTVNGVSSDETRLDANAGIGKRDPQNLRLAQQYQDFVHEALINKLKQHGIKIPESLQHGKPHEAVLTGDDLAYFNQIRKDDHFKTNFDLIEAFKSKHGLQDSDAEGFLEEVLAANRGATISVHLATPKGHVVVKVFDITTKRCVTTTTTLETTSTTTHHRHHNIPLTIIPLVPIVRRRRQRRPGRPGTYRINTPTRDTIVPDQAPVVPTTPASATSSRRPPRSTPPERLRPPRREHPRLRRALGMATTGLMAAGGLLFVSSLRGDVGYCPKVENHLKQDFRWNDWPEYFGVKLQIPFTDIKTGELPFEYRFNDECTRPTHETPKYPTPTDIPAPQPICDTRSILIVNGGKAVVTDQSHYPGATVITRKRVS